MPLESGGNMGKPRMGRKTPRGFRPWLLAYAAPRLKRLTDFSSCEFGLQPVTFTT